MTALVTYEGKQLDLIRRTVAKDCDAAEFDQFIHICKAVRLDPLRRQIYAFVFSKDDPYRRQMTVVTAIGGYRAIAERTGNYRPDNRVPRITYDETLVGPANPLGIIKCEVSVFKFSHGDWHEVVAEAYWDDYAPIIQGGAEGFEWEDTGEVYPNGHAKAGKPKYRKKLLGKVTATLDPNKGGWQKGRIMLQKCAEAQALRKAWPDDFDGIEVEEEIDRRAVDITPSDAANEAVADAKLAMIGGKNALTVMWEHGAKLDRVPEGEFCDRVLRWSSDKDRTTTELAIWWKANEMARAEYKARHGAEYLEFQRAFEAIGNRLSQQEAA